MEYDILLLVSEICIFSGNLHDMLMKCSGNWLLHGISVFVSLTQIHTWHKVLSFTAFLPPLTVYPAFPPPSTVYPDPELK